MDITKYFLIALSFACVSTLVTPAHAQSAKSTAASSKSTEPVESRTGARFVISNAIGGSLPSTLYYRSSGGYFYPLTVGSRLPSKRLAYPSNGKFYFWDKNPNPQQILPSADGKMTAAQAAESKAQQAEVKIPAPYLTVNVSAGAGSRSICILQPRITEADGKKKISALSTFLNESSIPSSGQSVLNLSRYPLYLWIAEKTDFSDKKQVLIKPCADVKSIEAGNIYNFAGSTGQKISFILNVKLPNEADLRRVKASSFVISKNQVQVAIILSDPNKAAVKMETLQIMRK